MQPSWTLLKEAPVLNGSGEDPRPCTVGLDNSPRQAEERQTKCKVPVFALRYSFTLRTQGGYVVRSGGREAEEDWASTLGATQQPKERQLPITLLIYCPDPSNCHGQGKAGTRP